MAKEKKDEMPALVSPAEFTKIPLDFIIATPLLTTIRAHAQAAQTTLDFVKQMNLADAVEFETSVETKDGSGGTQTKGQKIKVPLLALVKVPSLNFDSLSISFSYNISQVYHEKSQTTSGAKIEAGTTGLLSSFVSAKLAGNIEHTTNRENTANRGGTLEVKVHVSESQLPAGLQKIINAITDNIEYQPASGTSGPA